MLAEAGARQSDRERSVEMAGLEEISSWLAAQVKHLVLEVAERAVGGEGGGGGEHVEVHLSAEELRELRSAGFARIEYKIGRGGKGGAGRGEDGEDAVVNFVTSDGRVLKSITARGGRGGRMGAGG